MPRPSPPQSSPSSLLLSLALVAGAVALVFWIYFPALHGAPLWDDNEALFTNPLIRVPAGLRQIWTTHAAPDLWPLHYTYFWWTWHWWGDVANAGRVYTLPYHAVNIALHLVNSGLCFLALRRCQARGAWLAALLFAVHPVNTEAVAWIVQFKTLAAVGLAISALLLYLHGLVPTVRGRGLLPTSAAGFLFLASLLTKPVLIFLPLAMLVAAYRPLGWRRAAVRAAPFLGLSLVLGIAGVHWYASDAQLPPGDALPEISLAMRLARLGWMFWFYLRQAAWPWQLAFLYPQWPPWQAGSQAPTNFIAAVGLAAPLVLLLVLIVIAGSLQQRRRPALACALGYYLLALLPVLGLFDIYFLRFAPLADHWQYPALIAPIALAVHVAATRLERLSQLWRRLAVAASCGLAAVLAISAHAQTYRFASEEALWRHALSENPDSALAHNNLGKALADRAAFAEAEQEYAKALHLNSEFRDAYNNLGALRLQQGDAAAAVPPLHRALTLWPNFAAAQANLGVALTRTGDLTAATGPLARATELSPSDASYHKNYAFTLLRLNRWQDAAREYRLAVDLEPSADHWNDLGQLYRQAGDLKAAEGALREALRLDPQHTLATANLGLVTSANGNPALGLQLLRQAVMQDPSSPALHQALASVYTELGRSFEAATELATAAKLSKKP